MPAVIREVSEAELRRWLAGRHDWPDDQWEDHCGDPDCEHSRCADDYMVEGDARAASARQLMHDRLGLMPE